MGLRPGRTLKGKERPYTRISHKKPRKSYVRGVPGIRIHQFEMGNKKDEFNTSIYLIAKRAGQIRHNALESARIVAHKFLETKIGVNNYFFKILVYPHHVVREKPIATGAGADRYSQGMRRSFGKPSGKVVRAKIGQRVMRLNLNKEHIEIGKKALKKAGYKLPMPITIELKQ